MIRFISIVIVCGLCIFGLCGPCNPMRLFNDQGLAPGDFVEYGGGHYIVQRTEQTTVSLIQAQYPHAAPSFYDAPSSQCRKVSRSNVYSKADERRLKSIEDYYYSGKSLAQHVKEEETGVKEKDGGIFLDIVMLLFLSPVGWGILLLVSIGFTIWFLKSSHKVATKDYSPVENKEEKYLDALANAEDEPTVEEEEET